MTTPIPTLPQTICLLAFSRGEQPPVMQPVTRRGMLQRRWIAPTGTKGRYEIMRAGSDALATSPHLAQAQRALDEARRRRA